MSAEVLRRAAALMRERAEYLDGDVWVRRGPWVCTETGKHTCGTGPEGHYGAHEPGCGLEPVVEVGEPLAWHIASWHPAVAEKIARWLDAAAGEAELIGIDHHALAVARTYLGEESP